jgi:hypothetical protein
LKRCTSRIGKYFLYMLRFEPETLGQTTDTLANSAMPLLWYIFFHFSIWQDDLRDTWHKSWCYNFMSFPKDNFCIRNFTRKYTFSWALVAETCLTYIFTCITIILFFIKTVDFEYLSKFVVLTKIIKAFQLFDNHIFSARNFLLLANF